MNKSGSTSTAPSWPPWAWGWRITGREDGRLLRGQRQAVALLMATMTPLKFSSWTSIPALDPKTAETIVILTGKVVQEKGLTALMVTHNLRYVWSTGTGC